MAAEEAFEAGESRYVETESGIPIGEWDGPGERTRERYADSYAVKCPWHGWEYDIETGQLLRDDQMQVPIFDVTVENGSVYVQL